MCTRIKSKLMKNQLYALVLDKGGDAQTPSELNGQPMKIYMLLSALGEYETTDQFNVEYEEQNSVLLTVSVSYIKHQVAA